MTGGKTQLVPDLADDVFFESYQVALGTWGLGGTFSVKPLRLDYGVTELTDSMGNPIGTFRSYEEVNSWGLGMNVIEAGENLLQLFVPPPFSLVRYADFSLGHKTKDIKIDLAPSGLPGFSSGPGSATVHDFGIHGRLTPWNAMDHPMPEYVQQGAPGLASVLSAMGGLRVDLAAGKSWLNYNDATIAFVPGLPPDPILPIDRRGFSFRVATGVPQPVQDALDKNAAGWVASLFTPVVSFGKAWDRETTESGGRENKVEHDGWELTLLNIFSIRRGSVVNKAGGVNGDTEGWGLGFQLGDIAGLRWDEATIPQAVGLGRVHRDGFTAFVDVVAFARAMQNR